MSSEARDPGGNPLPPADGEVPDSPPPGSEGDRGKGPGRGRGRATLKALGWIVVGFVLLALLLLRTAMGHQIVLEWGLDRVRGSVAGTLEVGEIRSGNLLEGGRLVDIRMLTPRGDTLVVADSLEASWSLRALIGGRLGVSGVHLWGGWVNVSQPSTGAPSTLAAWIGGAGADSTAADSIAAADSVAVAQDTLSPGEGTTGGFPGFSLSRVALTDVAFRMRLPTELEPEGLVRVDTTGTPRMALDLMLEEARLPRIRIGGAGEATEFDVRRAEGRLDILSEPIFIERLAMGVTVGADAVAVQLRELILPEAEAAGSVVVSLDSTTANTVELALDLTDLDLGPLQWISPQMPPVTGSTRLDGVVRRDGSEWTAADADLVWDGADVRGGGTVRLTGSALRLAGVELSTSGLPVGSLDRWLPDAFDVGGRLGGRATVSGSLARLEVDGEVTWTTPEGEPVALQGGGGVTGLGGGAVPGFDDFSAVVGPFEWSTLRTSAGLPVPIEGPGSVRADLFGSLESGLRVSGEARHLGRPGVPASRVLLDGIVRQQDGDFGLDLSADLSPLALDVIRLEPDSTGERDLPIRGTLSGSVRVTGGTDRLRVSADLGDGTGDLRVDAEFDPDDPTTGYSISGVVDGLSGDIFTALGPSTRLTGALSVSGGGATLAGSNIVFTADFDDSRISGVDLDSLVLRGAVAEGSLQLDSLRGTLGGFAVDASGALALSDTVRSGTIRTRFETESLLGLRSTFLGDSILARPEDGLERRALEAEGIDPDTLPSPEQVEWDGAVRGEATLTGWIESFSLDGTAVASDVRIGPNRVDSVQLVARGVRLPGSEAELEVSATADSLLVLDRSFSSARAEGTFGRRSGAVTLGLERGTAEEYGASGTYELEASTRRVRIDQLNARFDSLQYELQRTAGVVWGDSALTIEDFEIRRLGSDPVVIRADGTLPRTGEVDLDVSVEGLYLDRLTQVLQRTDIDVGGRVDLDASITGTAASPIAFASVRAEDLRWRRLEVGSLNGRIDYTDRLADLDVRATRDGEIVLDVTGRVPFDLSLRPGTERFPEEEMSVDIRANDLPAGATVAPLEDLENVEGRVSGRLEVAGTVRTPRTSGSLTLDDGAWTVGSLGVRHTDVQGTAVLDQDNVLDMTVTARAGGTVEVEGTIDLDTPTNPTFDLGFEFDEFQGVDRRDIVGVVSGNVRLTETYRSPLIEGPLSVDEGTIFLDEFVRNAQVVDLTSTRLSGLLGQEAGNRLLEIAGNPFMNGLRTNIDLEVESNTWLRGRDLDVEMVGNVTMVFDRRARDFALDGELEARRGQYTTLGRTFQVQDGTVGFIGTPGINPILDITATTRVRRQEFGDLAVTANVLGTLVEPRVQLSADEEALSESDIISYLLTGQPSSGITSSLAGSGDRALGAVTGTGVSLLTGTIFSRLGALAAQQTDVIDYLSITGASDAGVAGGIGSPLSSTQVEVGRYFAGGDIFGAVVFRAADLGTQPVGGARLEWQSSEQFHVEAFFEDRFLRVASVGLAELGAGSAYVFGFALVREWGY